MKKSLYILILGISLMNLGFQTPVAVPPRETGAKAASKYFETPKNSTTSSSGSSGTHYLAIHLGGYFSSESYRWGPTNESDVAKFNGGISYRFDEWINSGDKLVRIDFSSFEFKNGERSTKMSVLGAISFPDATSRFPFYFGAAVGPGVFFKQLSGESAISLDYQLFLGLRFMNIFESTGLFIESGFKNHINLLSDGQLNATFFSAGAVFTF